MNHIPISDISITEVVYDMMMVQVNCTSLIDRGLSYVIRSQANPNKFVRKGNLSSYNVQLRMAHLEDGKYEFDMFVEDKLYLNIPFEKRSLSIKSMILA